MKNLLATIIIFLYAITTVYAEDRLELETTFIKGNKELPQILYVVPWKDTKSKKNKEQRIVLYSLFGDLFEPMNPEKIKKNKFNAE